MSQMWVRMAAVTRSLVSGTAGMPVRRRRRADVVLLVIAALLVGAVAMIGAATGDGERITGLWTSARIAADGSARVTEVIDYDFGGESRHGIFRDVPGLAPDARVSVSSDTAPDQFELVDLGGATRIRIGDPARTISGRHRYRIEYPLDGLAPGGRLAWDAVGTAWPVEVDGIEIHVVAPYELTATRCARGLVGSQQPCDLAQPAPGHLVAQIDTLDPREGATLYAGAGRQLGDAPSLPAPPSGAITDQGISPLLPGLWAAAVALLTAGSALWLLRRRGRQRVATGAAPPAGAPAWGASPAPAVEVRVDSGKLEASVTPGASPPPELTPPQGGILMAEELRGEHKVAWLINAAIDGQIDIKGSGRRVTLLRRADAGAPAPDPATAALLRQLFAGRERLALGSYKASFAAAWKQLGEQLAGWRRECGLWDPAGDRRCRRARLLGLVFAPLGLVLTFIGGATAGWPDNSGWQLLTAIGAVAPAAGLTALVGAWELRVRTPAGSALWLRVESLRRLLAEPGARPAEMATGNGQLGRYTAWAVALGELDRWSRAVKASTVAPSGGAPMYGPGIAQALWHASAASSRAPASSGGSGGGFGGGTSGGGGGVGGGGGGGGGGSW